MFKYFIFSLKATLSDYLTMTDILASKDVEKGYVVYDHRTYTACLGMQLHEDSDLDPPKLLPQFICILGDTGIDTDDLDQPFGIHDGLFMSMTSCDLVCTKNLAAERSAIAERLGVKFEDDGVWVLGGKV